MAMGHSVRAAIPLILAFLAVTRAEGTMEDRVRTGMRQAADAFAALSYQGAYPFLISDDLQRRYNCGHGALRVFPDETWVSVEPPATPWVGRTYLRAFRATGDPAFLHYAEQVGDALATIQLAVGGWRMRQPLSDEWKDKECPAGYQKGPFADLDDNRSQGPTLFFIELVRDGSTHAHHRQAMERGIEMLLAAQYPSGGWPQIYPPPENQDDYRRYHTLNDSSMIDCMRTLLLAYRTFGDQRCLDAVLRAGDWLLQRRLPGAAWAQQYYDDFVTGPRIPNHPAPARWFEPIAITASETASVVQMLRELWLETGNEAFIDAFPEVIDWYERSRLADGRWARLYELQTNRPLYCTPKRIITHSDEDLRPGYAWKGSWGNAAIATMRAALDLGRDAILAQRAQPPNDETLIQLEQTANQTLDALDNRGLWVVSRGPEERNIRVDEFNRRMAQLCAYLEAHAKRD